MNTAHPHSRSGDDHIPSNALANGPPITFRRIDGPSEHDHHLQRRARRRRTAAHPPCTRVPAQRATQSTPFRAGETGRGWPHRRTYAVPWSFRCSTMISPSILLLAVPPAAPPSCAPRSAPPPRTDAVVESRDRSVLHASKGLHIETKCTQFQLIHYLGELPHAYPKRQATRRKPRLDALPQDPRRARE